MFSNLIDKSESLSAAELSEVIKPESTFWPVDCSNMKKKKIIKNPVTKKLKKLLSERYLK